MVLMHWGAKLDFNLLMKISSCMMLKYTREIEAEWWMKLNFVFAASNWIFGPNHMGRVIVIFVRVTRSLWIATSISSFPLFIIKTGTEMKSERKMARRRLRRYYCPNLIVDASSLYSTILFLFLCWVSRHFVKIMEI